MKQNLVGIDIIEISRIRQAVAHWGERFLKRIFTEAEIKSYGGRVESLAARFAGKEAVMKALSPPSGFIGWKEIEILSEPNGRPNVRLYGRAKARAAEIELSSIQISLSHSRDYAVALVIGSGEM